MTIRGDLISELFSETQSRFVVSVKKEHQEAFEQLVEAKRIGEVTDDGTFTVNGEQGETIIRLSVDDLRNVWKGAIPCLLKSKD